MDELAAVQQLLVGIPNTLDVTLVDKDGEPDQSLTATVTVARANGTVLHTAQATVNNNDGTYSYTLATADLAALDALVATWTVNGAVRAVTAHEIVGGFYFSQGEVATAEAGRAAQDGQDFATLLAEVEVECERMTYAVFVPRYRRVVLDGTGFDTLILPHRPVRTLRSITYWNADGSTTAADLTTMVAQPNGAVAIRSAGSPATVFPAGRQNITVEYEVGFDRPPADLKRTTIRRYRQRSNKAKSGILDKALSYTAENGATYRIATPDDESTGDPEIDAVYQGYAKRYRPIVFA